MDRMFFGLLFLMAVGLGGSLLLQNIAYLGFAFFVLFCGVLLVGFDVFSSNKKKEVRPRARWEWRGK